MNTNYICESRNPGDKTTWSYISTLRRLRQQRIIKGLKGKMDNKLLAKSSSANKSQTDYGYKKGNSDGI